MKRSLVFTLAPSTALGICAGLTPMACAVAPPNMVAPSPVLSQRTTPQPAPLAQSALSTAPTTAFSTARFRCEYLSSPLGVEELKPRLSWVDQANGRGWMQSAYRIQVATNPVLLSAGMNAGKPDLWDSGKVMSDDTLNVRYAGKPLMSGQKCYWRVRVWDKSGQHSALSGVQTWQMGLLQPTDWKAQWITAQTPRTTKVDNIVLPPPPYLRKTFTLGKPIKSATLYATARGVYEMHLNGSKVSDEMLAPGWTDYPTRVQYQAYDVTSQVKRGSNTIGAILGDGWYSGYIGFSRQRSNYGASTALIAQLDVEYADGTHQLVVTDASWQGTTGPIEYSDLLQGEEYDARQELTGWDTTAYKGQGWMSTLLAPAPAKGGSTVDITQQVRAMVQNNTLSVVASNDIGGDPAYNTVKSLRVEYTLNGVAGSKVIAEKETLQIPAAGEGAGTLVIRRAVYGALDKEKPATKALIVGSRGPAVRVTQMLKPKKITQPTPGTYIYDMGQNMVGVVRLKVQGTAGTRVKLRFAEMLNPDGTAYTANLRSARATDTYICKGGGVETWVPHFTFHGFRYVEVTGFPGKPGMDAITGLVIGSDIPKTGTISTSSAMVNQLQSNIDWGQRGNFLSVPTDCPQRDERLGWMGDAQVFVRTATYNRDVAGFFEKWMQDVEDAQGADGGYSDVSPRMVEPNNGAPAWGDAGVIVPWTVYEAYGDKEVINRHWDSMTRWMNYITSVNPDGIWRQRRMNDFGDWLSIAANTPKEVLATGYYAYDAQLMAKMARATGRTQEAAQYDALFAHIKDAFNKAFVTADGKIQGDTQTCYLVGLRFNLLDPEMRPLAAQHLVDNIKAKDNHLSTGFVGVGYLCPVLSDTGNTDTAYKLLLNDTFPSWGYSIKQGATTIWERWDGWTQDKGFQDVGMNSFNHYSLGSVGEWLYRYAGGIDTDPNYPGFGRIVLQPHPGPGLTFLNTSFDSVHGRIVSNWKMVGGTTTYNVTVPANTTATLYLPATHAAQVQESGKPLAQAACVRFVKQDGNRSVLELGSGSYSFVVTGVAGM